MNDPYKILGVSPTATDDEVKKPTASSPENIIRTNMRAPILPILPLKK